MRVAKCVALVLVRNCLYVQYSLGTRYYAPCGHYEKCKNTTFMSGFIFIATLFIGNVAGGNENTITLIPTS